MNLQHEKKLCPFSLVELPSIYKNLSENLRPCLVGRKFLFSVFKLSKTRKTRLVTRIR